MFAMVLPARGARLQYCERPDPRPGPGEVCVEVSACGVCRTDLHVVDGELPDLSYPIIPGHEVVGRVDCVGAGVGGLEPGMRVGVPWLGSTCGHCPYCRSGQENLCDHPEFTGYTRDGGFASHLVADARYCFPLGEAGDDAALAPLLCAGLIGWRSLVMAGEGVNVGIYGFGAAGHIVAQVARSQGRSIYAFTRAGDMDAQQLALSLGACWAGASEDRPPVELDAAIIYAPVGPLVPLALRAVRKGGRVVCAGIHMSDIRTFPYNILWGERQIISVANLTRQDGIDFLKVAVRARIETHVTVFPLDQANEALSRLRDGKLIGAAVLSPDVVDHEDAPVGRGVHAAHRASAGARTGRSSVKRAPSPGPSLATCTLPPRLRAARAGNKVIESTSSAPVTWVFAIALNSSARCSAVRTRFGDSIVPHSQKEHV